MRTFILAFILGLFALGTVYAQPETKSDLVSREDSVITADVRNKITEDETLRGRVVSVTSQDGVVTLTGTVMSQTQADRAVELAKSIPGTVSVDNKLKIDSTAATGTPTLKERDEIVEKGEKELDEAADISGDARIINEMKAKLAGDELVKSRNIRMESTDGVVILKGTVRNKAEEEQAIRLANSVSGVREVRSELLIDPAAK